jgi:O-antigen ligase
VIGAYLGLTGVAEHYNLGFLVFPKYILSPEVGIQFGRVRGPFVSSTVDGGILLVAFVAICVVSSNVTGIRRLLTFLTALPVVASIYFTETRSIWISFAAIVATFAFCRTNIRKSVRVLGFLILVVFLSGVGSKFSLFENSLFSERQETIEYRLANYATIFNMVKTHPLFGIGYGNFKAEWHNYFVSFADIGNLEDGNHSILLGILAELGIVGFSIYLLILVCSMWTCIATYRRLDENFQFEKKFVITGIATLEVFFLIGLTSDLRFHQLLNVVLFLFVGLIVSLRRQLATVEDERSPAAPGEAPLLQLSGRQKTLPT